MFTVTQHLLPSTQKFNGILTGFNMSLAERRFAPNTGSGNLVEGGGGGGGGGPDPKVVACPKIFQEAHA